MSDVAYLVFTSSDEGGYSNEIIYSLDKLIDALNDKEDEEGGAVTPDFLDVVGHLSAGEEAFVEYESGAWTSVTAIASPLNPGHKHVIQVVHHGIPDEPVIYSDPSETTQRLTDIVSEVYGVEVVTREEAEDVIDENADGDVNVYQWSSVEVQ